MLYDALTGRTLHFNAVKVRNLENSVISRERMLRTNLEEISNRMVDKYDMAISHLNELNAEYAKRAYK
jgi:hypothetical protein